MSIANPTDRSYRRGIAGALFVADIFVAAYLIAISLASGIGPRTTILRELWQAWTLTGMLVTITFAISLIVVLEHRAGRRFPIGIAMTILTTLPIVTAIALLSSEIGR